MNIYISRDAANLDHYLLMADYTVRATIIEMADCINRRPVSALSPAEQDVMDAFCEELTEHPHAVACCYAWSLEDRRLYRERAGLKKAQVQARQDELARQAAVYAARQAQVIPCAEKRRGMRIVTREAAERIHKAGLSA